MNKLLIIVDPQVDFISGTLPVPGAADAMAQLAQWLPEHGADYSAIVITADWHPWAHCSFRQQGGPWPRHCVAYSPGAAIDGAVLAAAHSANARTCVLTKGTAKGRDEYSIFANAPSARKIHQLIERHQIEHIDLCGLAGDVCVAATLTQGRELYGNDFFTVLTQFSPSLDGGKTLQALLRHS